MRTMMKWGWALAAALVLAGCAGTKFVRPSDEQIRLGHTTSAEAIALLGKPFQEATGVSNGKSTRTLSYAYASMGEQAKSAGVTPVHGLTLVFSDDKLVSRSYMSNLKADATDFDDSKVPAIQQGKTTAAEVKAMFGQPSGEAIFPAIKHPRGRGLIYNYQEMRGFTPSTKLLLVVVDGEGVVTDVEYKTQGTWK